MPGLTLIGAIDLARTSSKGDAKNTKRMPMALRIFRKRIYEFYRIAFLFAGLEDSRMLSSVSGSSSISVLHDDG